MSAKMNNRAGTDAQHLDLADQTADCTIGWAVGLNSAFDREGKLATYRGIEYSMRASVGSEAWILRFAPTKDRVVNRRYIGPKEGAPAAAHKAIDQWLKRHPVTIRREMAKNSN